MERKYKIRLNIMGTNSAEIAEAIDFENKYCHVTKAKSAIFYKGNKKVFEIKETQNDYYLLKMDDKIMKSLLERIIIGQQGEKKLRENGKV